MFDRLDFGDSISGMKQKKITTIEDLAVMMKEEFERSDKNTDKKIENLATMMQGEFLAIHERFDDLESEIK
ncbi:MAG: hypothetical protein ACD_9C00044G0001 [uncultured bacterium]|nr:MAG: hypothetical protein ACD_9C00044G0001 [uncultured bacterium]KKQ45703.1 MAG: hypothetical protein US63_C0012G0038 [Candidatus Moranbacteria bacterium GW2011_GWC2_37_8]KKQ62835.1 MAG: hypothetical protein US82_C0005G0008 [Parcubacteria group bacterium GW2011_GWC1_38_22]